MGLEWSDRVDQVTIGVAAPPNCLCEEPPCDTDPVPVCLATVYTDGNCGGGAKKIRSDVLYRPREWEPLYGPVAYTTLTKGSWDHYNGASWPKFGSGMTQSVLFNGGCAIEVFNIGNFRSESFTMRQDPTKNYSCKEVTFIPELNGWKWATENGATNHEDAAGFSGYKAW